MAELPTHDTDTLTRCLIRETLRHYEDRRISQDVAVALIVALMECDREQRFSDR